MAAVSSATGTTALTPPSSSHGEEATWEYSGVQFENAAHDKTGAAARFDHAHRSPLGLQNGNAFPPSHHTTSGNGLDAGARKMHSVDNLSAARWDRPTEERVLSPPLAIESKARRGSSDWHSQHGDDRKRPLHQTLGLEIRDHEDSKWIHRDKLAKIESEELQAAGIFVPRTRPPSKQRRERSQSRLTRGTESVDMDSRPRKDSATLEQLLPSEPSTPHWDLRTPEEIAEAEANAYFTANGGKGGSRIPVAKTSPAPISMDYLERGSPAVRKPADNADGDAISYPKPRSRSASLSASVSISDQASTGPGQRIAKRSVTDTSPKKSSSRRPSAASKTSTSTGRPKTRSGPNKDAPGTRPPTRGEGSAASKQPEGDPPWMLNSYKPDPRLPPDQQLLPTVARRLQQEKWEKEGKFGDTYDKDFRPLNDNEFQKPPEPDFNAAQTEEETPHADEWPLKPGVAKSPTLRQGSYSTMPKISDKPLPVSPITSPRATTSGPPAQEKEQPPPAPVEDSEEKKGGCGCCVVM
ncbi:TeaA receptor TeaR [Purpureocillium lavendulum]|uniref:TeaA receptor TeaR n=1 Tax=Purpureocillium lavendulum TaxID=1247861 RepID=A0AB34FS15_9HYPO|nr:TeaA receptor TeaR [Purpureocillium lavendulum]